MSPDSPKGLARLAASEAATARGATFSLGLGVGLFQGRETRSSHYSFWHFGEAVIIEGSSAGFSSAQVAE